MPFSIPGPEVQTEMPHFRCFRYSSSFFAVILEKCGVSAVPPVEGRQGRSRVLGGTHGSHRGTEESGASRQPSGAGDLVRRHEPRVPEGPERHSAIWPDHQVGDAAIVERQAEPAFWRKLQCPAHNVADDIGVADEDLVTVLLLLGICPVDVVPEGSLDPGSIFIILHSLRLPVGHRWVGLDGGAFS